MTQNPAHIALLKGRFFAGEQPQILVATKASIKDKIWELFQDQVEESHLDELSTKLTGVYSQLSLASGATHLQLEEVKKLDALPPFATSAVKAVNIVAWLVRREAELAPMNSFMKKGLALLFEHKGFESGWLGDLLPATLPLYVVDRVYQSIVTSGQNIQKVTTAFYALAQVANDDCALSKAERLSLCIFAGSQATLNLSYIKKSDYKLPRSLQFDSEKKCAYLLSKRKVKVCPDDSTYKKVTSGILVPLELRAELEFIAQLVNIEETKEAVEKMSREAMRHQAVYRTARDGIWPLWNVSCYRKQRGLLDVPKISIIMPWAEGSLFQLFESKNKSIPIPLLRDVIRALTLGLDAIHQANLLHGDIKDTNVLYRMVANNPMKIGFTDFGFCFQADDEDSRPDIFKAGYYGSVTPTSPEYLGEPFFRGDYKVVEMWALGYMLYELVFGHVPSWQAILKTYLKLYEDTGSDEWVMVRPDDIDTIKGKVEEEIEKPRLVLLSKKRLNEKEELQLFVYDLMRLEPSSRLSSHDAVLRSRQL